MQAAALSEDPAINAALIQPEITATGRSSHG